MTNLSPAAQAVWSAFNNVSERVGVFEDYGDALAAALRAVADDVLPSPRLPFDSCCEIRSAGERVELLAIADELEGMSN
jgi:hypothetical protein